MLVRPGNAFKPSYSGLYLFFILLNRRNEIYANELLLFVILPVESFRPKCLKKINKYQLITKRQPFTHSLPNFPLFSNLHELNDTDDLRLKFSKVYDFMVQICSFSFDQFLLLFALGTKIGLLNHGFVIRCIQQSIYNNRLMKEQQFSTHSYITS